MKNKKIPWEVIAFIIFLFVPIIGIRIEEYTVSIPVYLNALGIVCVILYAKNEIIKAINENKTPKEENQESKK